VRRGLRLSVLLVCGLGLGLALGGCAAGSGSGTATGHRATTRRATARRATRRRHATPTRAAGAQLSLITEPQAGIAPLLAAIRGARRTVEMVMYEDEDGQVDAALAAARARGVSVRVLLNGGYYGAGSTDNQPAYRYLTARHVAVRFTPSYFALTHQKSLVVDGHAYILTFNLTPQYYASSRDFGVVDRDPADVAAIERTFAADYARVRLAAPAGHDLVWSPGSEPAQVSLIDSARGSIDIYNEEMDSTPVERALEDAAHRGVDVRVTMTYDTQWRAAFAALTSAGVHVRTYAADAPLYIHAKVILTPDRAFLGSENFSYTSLERNRELGITFTARSLIRSLRATFDRDYSQAQPFDGSGA
jgi:phosphatidylserine/phosphatidylglycerophosphate/cardiolipin synthase-like enzyme